MPHHGAAPFSQFYLFDLFDGARDTLRGPPLRGALGVQGGVGALEVDGTGFSSLLISRYA